MLMAAKARQDSVTVTELFGKRQGEIRSEVRRLQQIEAVLANEAASLESIYMNLNEPLIKDVPLQRIIAKKGTGPYSETISRLMPDLCGQIFSEENRKTA